MKTIEVRKWTGQIIDTYQLNTMIPLLDHVKDDYIRMGYYRLVEIIERKMSNGEKIVMVKSAPTAHSKGRIIEFHVEQK